MLVNLVVNARDAMPSGGELLIETANVTLDEAYASSHAGATPGEYVMLVVRDTGSGMTEEVQEHVFEPFFTTKGEDRGTGLGLATCYGIVKQMGGYIAVYSEVGLGTTMKVYLPRVHEEARVAQKPERQRLPRGTETILLVEDEPTVRDLAVRILRRQGYTLLEASDGNEALRLLEEHGGPVHLLLTDVVMPGLSGRELAARAQAAQPGIKVLFVSGYTDDAILQHRLLERGVVLLQKPFTPDSLAGKVREVLGASDGPSSGSVQA